MHRTGRPAWGSRDLHRRGVASAELATRLRRELVQWANELRVPTETVQDVELASYEAMANAVVHAYPPGTTGVMELDARLASDALIVTVTDHGRWRTDEHPSSGHGLPLIRGLPEQTDIAPGEHGTTVSMRWPT
jgi:serine/threonine-protein kinase RsbW